MSDIQQRGTGRTTRLAVALAYKALSAPGYWVVARDHHDTKAAHRALTYRASGILDALDVEHDFRSDAIKVTPR